MRAAFAFVAVAVTLVLQGCGREPVRTVVQAPPPDPVPALQPQAPASAAPGAPESPAAAASAAPATGTASASPDAMVANAPSGADGDAIPKTDPLEGALPPPIASLPSLPASAAVLGAGPAPAASAVPAPARGPVPLSRLPAGVPLGDAEGARLLSQRSLLVPVAGIDPANLSDQFLQPRGGRLHEAIDLMAPTGTPVFAVDDGKVAKLFHSKPGGLTVYQFDPAGQLAYYYAHLDRYAPNLREGQVLRRGDPIGYVGVTGNADPSGPHLHFAIFRLGPERRWWKGEAVNPYPALRQAQPVQLAAR